MATHAPLLILLGLLLFLHALCLVFNARRAAVFLEYALIVNALGLVALRVYLSLLGDRTGLAAKSAIAAGLAAIVYIAAIRMLKSKKVGIMVFFALILIGLISFAFISVQENEGVLVPGVTAPSKTLSEAEIRRQEQDNAAYLKNVALSAIKGDYYNDTIHGRSIFVECEIKNEGQKDIGTLTIDAILLSPNGEALAREEFYPVSDRAQLPALKRIHYLTRFSSTPENWNHNDLKIAITELRLAGNSMLSTAKFRPKEGRLDEK
ncbi:hypothetical protein J7M28_03675 [bacterium]|nr:hypothetical protein [bacterium]